MKKRYMKHFSQIKYFSWLLMHTKPYLPRIFLLLIFDFVSSMLTLWMAVVSKNIIDEAAGQKKVIYGILVYIAIVLVIQGIKVVDNLITVMVTEKYSFSLRKSIFDKILKSEWLSIEKYHTGDLITRLTSDVGNIADGIVEVLPTIFRLVLEILIMFFALFYYEPLLALFALLIGPVTSISSIWLGKKLKKLQLKVQESEAAYRSFMQESLSNLLVVKSFSNEDLTTQRLASLRDERFRWVWKKNTLMLISSTIVNLSFYIGYIGAFAYGAIQLSRKAISFGTVSLFITLVNRVQGPVMSLAQTVPKLVLIVASAGRVMELQEIPLEERANSFIDQDEIALRIENVSFGYEKEDVISDANIIINSHEFVAILGESGVGKTTLIRLILSFIKQIKGSVLFEDRQNHSEQVNVNTRKLIGYVPQGNTLFSGTIRDNVCMGKNDASEEEIIAALKIAAGYDFVSQLPNGLDTVIGERGVGLSEGQAQRIAIARAIVRRAPILILDEATSALDEQTELKVLGGLIGLSPRPTCIVITHRKSILKYCNREVFLENKRLTDRALNGG